MRVSRDRARDVAIIALSEGRTLTFADLIEEFHAARQVLAAARLDPRSRIVAVTGNRAGFFAMFLACLDLGYILVPLDGDSTASEVFSTAHTYGATAIVAADRVAAQRPTEGTALPGGLTLFQVPEADRRANGRRPEASASGSVAATAAGTGTDWPDVALLKITSGSSDLPKAVLTTEGNLWHDGRQVTAAMAIGPDDVNLGSIPLSHSYGLGNLVLPLLMHGTRVVLRDAFIPARLIDDMHACGVTVFPGVPFMFDFIVRHMPDAAFPPSLRLILSAGARLDFPLLRAFHDRFGRKIHSFYGSSESGGIAFDDGDDLDEPVTVGRPLDGVSVTFRPQQRRRRVHVRSDAVGLGYALDEAATSDAFIDEGFLTGDLGSFDARGRLVLEGRVSQFVNVAGRKVNIEEVERVLTAMPGIAQARVVDVPCTVRGQALVGCVVLDNPAPSVVDIRAFCARRLSAHKIPRDFIVLGALPLDDRGKIDRRALAVLAATTGAR